MNKQTKIILDGILIFLIEAITIFSIVFSIITLAYLIIKFVT